MTRTSGIIVILALLSGCQQKMAEQPSHGPDEPSDFFADGRASRPLVAGTVARGYLRTDVHLFAGRDPARTNPYNLAAALAGSGSVLAAAAVVEELSSDDANAALTFPFPMTAEVLQHGRNRYMIYCVVCHDPEGTGRGVVVERGYTPPPSYHIERLRQAPVGHFFEVITKGYGSMPAYGKQVPPRDRWAIIGYIRALQLSRHFPVGDLTDAMRQQWAAQGGK